MTPELLEQLRFLIREEIAASEARLLARQDQAVETLIARQDRAVEAMASNLSELSQEFTARFDHIDQDLASFGRRLDRMETNFHTVRLEMVDMSKSLTDAERLDTATAATLLAQQKAINDLYHRVRDLERRQNPQH